MTATHRRTCNVLASIAVPPAIQTAVLVGLALVGLGDSEWWGPLNLLEFILVLIPGFWFLVREFRLREFRLRALAIGIVYFPVMFWVTAGAALYASFFILATLGFPVTI